MLTIGIPRALVYYDHGALWACFYEALGARVVVSPDTTKDIVDRGVSLSVDDACFPLKVYHGHAAALVQKCDYLFIPRLVSIERRTYMCPKFLGLPDMVRATLGDSARLIAPTIDLSRSPRAMARAVILAAAAVTRNPVRSLSVWRNCLERQTTEAVKDPERHSKEGLCIGVLAHSYVVEDPILSMGLMDRLRAMGISVVLPADISCAEVESHISRLERHVFWTHERLIYGAGMAMVSTGLVSGIIIIQAFGCGPGSMIFDLFTRRCRRLSPVPVLNLSIDEHTGEAGIVTRLEAFVDMLARTERGCS